MPSQKIVLLPLPYADPCNTVLKNRERQGRERKRVGVRIFSS
jgi:hypothetical protein